MARLYEISDRYKNLEALLQDDETAIDTVLEAAIAVEDEFKTKAEAIARLILDVRGDIKKFKEEEDRLAVRRKTLAGKEDRLKAYLMDEMLETNLTKLKGETLSLSVQANSRGSVIIENEALVPDKYKVPQPPKIDNNGIYIAYQGGDKVPGTRVEYGQHLRIR